MAAPSANLFTHVSPTSAAHVFDDFFDQEVSILDLGQSTLGIESTIVKIHDYSAEFLRLGSLPFSDVESYLKSFPEFEKYEFKVMKKTQKEDQAVEAPGQFLKHYSPKIETKLFSQKSSAETKVDKDLKICLIDFGSKNIHLKDKVEFYEDLSVNRDIKEAMTRLYFLLRTAEGRKGLDLIVITDIEECRDMISAQDLKYVDAIADKMFRSASGSKINFIF